MRYRASWNGVPLGEFDEPFDTHVSLGRCAVVFDRAQASITATDKGLRTVLDGEFLGDFLDEANALAAIGARCVGNKRYSAKVETVLDTHWTLRKAGVEISFYATEIEVQRAIAGTHETGVFEIPGRVRTDIPHGQEFEMRRNG